MSEIYIKQEPESVHKEVGQSASIQCGITENIDIRELSLFKRNALVVKLGISDSSFSKTLKVHGTYDNFSWILNKVNYPCGHSVESSSTTCLDQTGEDSKLYLSNDNKQVAFLYMDISLDYRSRIRLSGTILNITFTLTDLMEIDRDSYTCHGKAEHIKEDIKGNDTRLIVEKSHHSSTGWLVTGILLGLIILGISIVLLIAYRKKWRKS
ncbi:uncharacterized protein ACMZJ9_018013 [Mantella aurantiaca]